MAGRPPNPNRKSTSYTILFPDQVFINNLDIIAKREGISRKAIVLKFLREGMARHDPGNPQTMLNSYAEGGEQTLHQLVGRLRQKFYNRNEVFKREILEDLKTQGVMGTDRVSIANSIVHWLKEQGKKVYE